MIEHPSMPRLKPPQLHQGFSTGGQEVLHMVPFCKTPLLQRCKVLCKRFPPVARILLTGPEAWWFIAPHKSPRALEPSSLVDTDAGT